MKLVPKHKLQQGVADGVLGSDLKAKQLQVQQKMKAAMASGGGDGSAERGGANGTLAEQQAKLEEMEALMAQQKLSSKQDSIPKKSVKFGGEDSKVFERDESAQEHVEDDGGHQEEVGVGGKLSKKEQYRLMMMNMTEQQGADEDEEEETELLQKKNAGVKKLQNSIVRTQVPNLDCPNSKLDCQKVAKLDCLNSGAVPAHQNRHDHKGKESNSIQFRYRALL